MIANEIQKIIDYADNLIKKRIEEIKELTKQKNIKKIKELLISLRMMGLAYF